MARWDLWQVPYELLDLLEGTERVLTNLAEWPEEANYGSTRGKKRYRVKEPMVFKILLFFCWSANLCLEMMKHMFRLINTVPLQN
jgi:hypothetical protein